MKVKELIEKLKEFDPETEVAYEDHEQCGYLAVKRIAKTIVDNNEYSSDWAFRDAMIQLKK